MFLWPAFLTLGTFSDLQYLKFANMEKMKENIMKIQDHQNLNDLRPVILGVSESLRDNKGKRIYKYLIEAVERILIEDVMVRTEGNQLKAARLLGINRNTLRYKIKRFGIDTK